MKEEQKIYIRGSKDRPDDVRKVLEQHGGKIRKEINFTYENGIYYIGYDDGVHYTSDFADIPEISQLYKMITEYYHEVKLPDSSKCLKTGDILVSNDNSNEFYVFDKFTKEGNILVYLKVAKSPIEDKILRINEQYCLVRLVPHISLHKANDKELKTFYSILAAGNLTWNAYSKLLIQGDYTYFYPKNGHYYSKRDIIRCKDRATGEWYDAVLYSDANGQYVREVNDFTEKFNKVY